MQWEDCLIVIYRSFADGPLPAVLQEVDLPIINNTQCEAMYEKAGFREHIPHIFICAGYREGGKDSCEVKMTSFGLQIDTLCLLHSTQLPSYSLH